MRLQDGRIDDHTWADLQSALVASHVRPRLGVGDRVRHLFRGWTGRITVISEEESCGQGRLITVYPVFMGDVKWNAITVTEGELIRLADTR